MKDSSVCSLEAWTEIPSNIVPELELWNECRKGKTQGYVIANRYGTINPNVPSIVNLEGQISPAPPPSNVPSRY